MAAQAEPYAETIDGRIVLVHFPRVEDVVAAKSPPLVLPLVEATKLGRAVLLADAPAELRIVEPSMVSFWLGALSRPDVDVSHIGVVTKSRAVKAVLGAVRTALSLRSRSLDVGTFDTVEQAVAWGRSHL